MKIAVLLSISLILLTTNVKSQINKNNWMIGGAASLRSSKYDVGGGATNKQFIVQLSGDVGYFIIDKFAAGLKPGYSRTETNSTHNIVNTYNIGPFIRYYFLPKEKYVNLFSEFGYQYGKTKTNQGVSQNSNNLSAIAGCAVFFNSSVALEFTLGYSSFSYNTSGNVKSLISGIGFHFHLEKEK